MLPCSLYYLSISCPRVSVRSQQAPSCYAVLIILESHIFVRCGRLCYVGKTRCCNASEQNGFTEWIHRTASLAYNACAQLLSQHASKKKLAINAAPLWNLGKFTGITSYRNAAQTVKSFHQRKFVNQHTHTSLNHHEHDLRCLLRPVAAVSHADSVFAVTAP